MEFKETGTCQHGTFPLREGCPKCITKRRQDGIRPEQDEMEDGLNSEGLTLSHNLGKVQYYSTEESFTIKPILEETTGTALVTVNPRNDQAIIALYEQGLELLRYAEARVFLTNDDLKPATDDLAIISKVLKGMEEKRKEYLKPFQDHIKETNEAYKFFMEPIEAADKITRGKMVIFKVEQQRKVAEAEKLNWDAIDLARRQAEANNGEFTIDIKPVPVPFAPKLTRTDMGKSGLIDNWKFRIIDLEKLPREYMVPDEAMLNSIAKKHHDNKQVPGVEFYNEPGLRVSR